MYETKFHFGVANYKQVRLRHTTEQFQGSLDRSLIQKPSLPIHERRQGLELGGERSNETWFLVKEKEVADDRIDKEQNEADNCGFRKIVGPRIK